MENIQNLLIAISLGIGLSACCGFRIFIPLLITNIASLLHFYHYSQGFEWMGSIIAFYVLLVATVLEISAYYIPWLDNALDYIALPIASIAGILLTTSLFGEANPIIKWILGIIIGGGSAAVVHSGITLLRLGSTTTTGGIGNPVISTVENISAIVFSVLTLFIPIVIGVFALIFIIFIGRKLIKKVTGRQTINSPKDNIY